MARNESLGGRPVCRDVKSTDTAGRKPRLRPGRGLLKGSAGACVEAASAEDAACASYPSVALRFFGFRNGYLKTLSKGSLVALTVSLLVIEVVSWRYYSLFNSNVIIVLTPRKIITVEGDDRALLLFDMLPPLAEVRSPQRNGRIFQIRIGSHSPLGMRSEDTWSAVSSSCRLSSASPVASSIPGSSIPGSAQYCSWVCDSDELLGALSGRGGYIWGLSFVPYAFGTKVRSNIVSISAADVRKLAATGTLDLHRE